MKSYSRMVAPRGLVTASLAALVIVWGLYLLDPDAWPGRTGAIAQSGLVAGNLLLTTCSRSAKRRLVRLLQGRVVNPLVLLGFRVGLNPLGLVVLETVGRRSGLPRRVPVGTGRDRRDPSRFWVVAEHGLRAAYVRNLLADDRVRVLVRRGLHREWLEGRAVVLPDDDVVARQREIVGWRPLRALNALTVRMLGTDLVTVMITVTPAVSTPGVSGVATGAAAPEPLSTPGCLGRAPQPTSVG